ncbi:dihydrodipicolinate synthase family protein [Halobacillus trueperi]|uniref:Dihydrodipicolinate synthase family protein n=1 Tax=Halobacillus trueperi TaxID=156205 RepID=A0A3E0JBK9_9BACI|nr:dihydrodipicolinate synthase family protein [Halobacillus trueperi]REJ10316.1 dihydrodipicolinate synthase family protein [Halobacillus trueperi]
MAQTLQSPIRTLLHEGTVIPAHPLALHKDRTLDEERQRALTNYYISSGAGGVAVGVHTTQFEIRDEGIDLYETVLRMAVEEIDQANLSRPFIKVAGVVGELDQAREEAEIAKGLGYDLALVSMGGLSHLNEEEHLERVKAMAEIMPVFGFYLQPAVGGRVFSYEFWRAFADIQGVCAIKLAPFDRYQTIDVVRAVCHSKRRDDIALYTGNDDHIVDDLLTTFRFRIDGKVLSKSIVGGLLGQWAVWTSKAVTLLDQVKEAKQSRLIPAELLTAGAELTDANAAIFDAANGFKGSIAGINEILRRQGLLRERLCLMEHERLSPGQEKEIDRIHEDYPHLNDDAFVKNHIQSGVL